MFFLAIIFLQISLFLTCTASSGISRLNHITLDSSLFFICPKLIAIWGQRYQQLYDFFLGRFSYFLIFFIISCRHLSLLPMHIWIFVSHLSSSDIRREVWYLISAWFWCPQYVAGTLSCLFVNAHRVCFLNFKRYWSKKLNIKRKFRWIICFIFKTIVFLVAFDKVESHEKYFRVNDRFFRTHLNDLTCKLR